MDKKTIELLIQTLPSEVMKLVLKGTYRPFFLLTGIVEQITDTSIIFRTKTKRSAIQFEEILELVPMGRQEL